MSFGVCCCPLMLFVVKGLSSFAVCCTLVSAVVCRCSVFVGRCVLLFAVCYVLFVVCCLLFAGC